MRYVAGEDMIDVDNNKPLAMMNLGTAQLEKS